jgi:hypothetical protein
MAVPTTLADFWKNEVDAYTKLQGEVSGQLKAAQTALEARRTALGDALGALASAKTALDAARRTLAAETDLGELPAETVAVRRWQAVANAAAGAVTRASDALAEQQVAVAALTDTSGASAAKLQEATAAKAAADADAPVRADLRAKAAAAPLSTLIADAKVAADPTKDPVLSARKNLNDNFLEHGYMDLADARFEVEQAASQGAFAEDRAVRKAYTGQFPAGASAEAVVAWRSELARTRAELSDFVSRAKARFDLAVSTLTALGTAADVASPNEVAEFNGGSLSGPGITVAGAQGTKDRDAALLTLLQKQSAYELAIDAALAADPTVDPATVAAVSTARGERDTAAQDLAAKQTAYDTLADPTKPWTSPHATLAAWLSALPDGVYRKVAGYYEARATLEELGGLTAGGVADPLAAFDAAESACAASLDAAARAEKAAFFHGKAVEAVEKRLQRVGQSRRDHLLSTVRGDL